MADGARGEEQKEDVLANKSAKNTKIATKYAISVFQEYCQSLHGHANAYDIFRVQFVSAILPVRP
jgi:hypothetical protein